MNWESKYVGKRKNIFIGIIDYCVWDSSKDIDSGLVDVLLNYIWRVKECLGR